VTGLLQANLTWSKLAAPANALQPGLFQPVDQSISGSLTLHTRDNRYGGLYSPNYDILNKSMLNQRISGYYNTQCCGIAFEYDTTNYGAALSQFVGVTADRRFFLSFTLVIVIHLFQAGVNDGEIRADLGTQRTKSLGRRDAPVG